MKEKLNIQLLTAAILSIGGLVMLFCGIYIEPLGQIHDSLLIGFGEVATFAGALFGIDYTYKIRNYHENQNDTRMGKGKRPERKNRSAISNAANVPNTRKRFPPNPGRNVPPQNDVVAEVQKNDAGDL